MDFENIKLGQEIEFLADNIKDGVFDYEVKKGEVKALFINSTGYKCLQVEVDGERHDVEFARTNTSDEFKETLIKVETHVKDFKADKQVEFEELRNNFVTELNEYVTEQYNAIYK